MSTPPPPCSLILPLPADLHQWYLCRHVLDSYSQLAASPTPPSWLPAVETSGEVAFIASFHVKTFIAIFLEGSPVLQTIMWSRPSWELCSAWPLECGGPDYHCEWRQWCFSSWHVFNILKLWDHNEWRKVFFFFDMFSTLPCQGAGLRHGGGKQRRLESWKIYLQLRPAHQIQVLPLLETS